ncbi:MAG: PEP-CTERM sorting domain-containing protein [Pirellulales bacterium]
MLRAHGLPLVCSLAVCLALGSARLAHCATVQTPTNQTNGTNTLNHTFSPSAADLLNGLAPSAQAGNFTQEGSGGVAVLTNGTMANPITRNGGGAFQFGQFATGGNTGGTSVTYTLPSRSNISAVDVYGAWQDGGRDQQSYTVSYSTGFGYTPFATVNYNPTDPAGMPQATRVNLVNTGGNLNLATNVTSLRFDFNGTENGYSGYAEIDAFGTASGVFAAGKVGAGSAPGGANNLDGAGAPRLNVDLANTLNLGAGTYRINDTSFAADAGNGSGAIRTFLARETGANTYETVWVSDLYQPLANGLFSDTAFAIPQFTLAADTVLFAGIYHDGVARVYYNDDATLTNHNATSVVAPATVGEPIAGFSNPGLNNRTYKFEVNVSAVAVPEPHTIGLVGLGVVGLICVHRRLR